MSFPPSLTTRTVKGRFVTYPDGKPAAGVVRIVLENAMQGPTDDIILAPFDISIDLDANGEFAAVLPSTNDPQWTPGVYKIIIRFAGTTLKTIRTRLSVPYQGSGPVYLSDVLNLPAPTPGQTYVLAANLGMPNGVATLGPDGKVTASQLPITAGGVVSWDDIENKPATFPTETPVVSWSDVQSKPTSYPATAHSHEVSDVSGLASTLTSKADTSSVAAALATKADSTSLTVGLSTKADVSAVNAALAAKADTSHSHTTTQVTGLDDALSSKVDASTMSSALAGKANTTHTHSTAQVTGLDAALSGKASSTHSHSFSDITDKPATYPHAPITWDEIEDKPTVFPGDGSGGTGGSATSVEWVNVQNKPSTFPATPDSWTDITDKPSTYPPSSHTHLWADTTDKPTAFPPTVHTHAYSSLTGIPASFVPAAHAHAIADITDLDAALSSKASTVHTHAYSSLTGIPSTFAPSAHTHLWADLTDKPTTYTPSAHGHAIADITNLSSTLAGKSDTGHTHSYSTLTGIPSTFAPSAHNHSTGDITGLTTALDSKAPLASPTFTGTVSGVTKAHVGLGNVDNTSDTGKPVSTAQQTALNLKANLASPTFTGTPAAPTATAGTSSTQIATTAFVTSGLSGKSDSSHTHTYSSITGKPTLATVATTGSYNDLLDKPSGSGGSSSSPSVDLNFTPEDHDLIGWTYDPALCDSYSVFPESTTYLAKIKLPGTSTLISTVHVGVWTGGIGLTEGQCLIGLYSQSGVLLSTAPSQHIAWETGGIKSATLAVPQTISTPYCFVGLSVHGSDTPTFIALYGASIDTPVVNLSGLSMRFIQSNDATAEGLPPTLTIAQPGWRYFWAAVS